MSDKYKFEVYTAVDKIKRDELFQALRKSDDPFERQAVKFSGNEPVLDSDGKQIVLTKLYLTAGAKNPKRQPRPVYRSTWSVAHPKSENGEYYSGGKNV
jgi:hypothetical protein